MPMIPISLARRVYRSLRGRPAPTRIVYRQRPVERPAIMTMGGQWLPLDGVILVPARLSEDSDEWVIIESLAQMAICDDAGRQQTFETLSAARIWLQYVIELAHEPAEHIAGYTMLCPADYPGGTRYARWRRRSDPMASERT